MNNDQIIQSLMAYLLKIAYKTLQDTKKYIKELDSE